MPPDISDAFLDILWDRHLDGKYLPLHVLASMTRRGPLIVLQGDVATHCRVKQRHLRDGRIWRKTLAAV